MMYRPTAAAATARRFMRIAIDAGTNAIATVVDALKGAMISAGLYEQAMRENRQYDRAQKRFNWHQRARDTGLNGPRAVARRRRQIEAGSLRVENGLCQAVQS